MSAIQSVDLARAYLLLNHGPTVLVTSAHEQARNVMAAAWAMPLDFDPPKMLVVVDKSTYTRELIEASGEFALCIPTRMQGQAIMSVGSLSGREHDKFQTSGLSTFPASKIAAPLIEGCLAWLECKVVPEPHNQSRYDLFIGEVVAAWADSSVFSANRWHFTDDAKRSVHYVAGGSFFATGESFSALEEE